MKSVKGKILVVLGLVLAVKLGLGVIKLWKTGGLVEEAQKEVLDLKKENASLQEKLVYVNSPEFVEKEARDKLGYGREGEVILVLPDQNANLNSQISNFKLKISNWRLWWDLYIRI